MASLAVEPDGSVTMSVVPNAVSAVCPVSSTPSQRRHTWYRRTAMDLPWRKFTVRLRVWARRFFCDEPTCPRKIFAERFTGLLPRYARRTEEATVLLLALPNELVAKLERDSLEPRVCRPVQIRCGVSCAIKGSPTLAWAP